MSVREVLDKITTSYPDVIGAAVKRGETIHHNFEAPYDMVSTDLIMETFGEIFDAASALKDEGHDFKELIIDFETHSFIVTVIAGGLLVVLAGRVQRAQLIRIQVGLSIFSRSVAKALDEAGEKLVLCAEAPPEEAVQTAEEAAAPAETHPQESSFGQKLLNRLRGRSGKDGEVATPGPAPTGPDGKPKKARYYRGQAYYD